MKNEFGIKVCCNNCDNPSCFGVEDECMYCSESECQKFCPSIEACKERIKELQDKAEIISREDWSVVVGALTIVRDHSDLNVAGDAKEAITNIIDKIKIIVNS